MLQSLVKEIVHLRLGCLFNLHFKGESFTNTHLSELPLSE